MKARSRGRRTLNHNRPFALRLTGYGYFPPCNARESKLPLLLKISRRKLICRKFVAPAGNVYMQAGIYLGKLYECRFQGAH